MKRRFWVGTITLVLCLSVMGASESSESGPFTYAPFERGINIPITLTTTTATAITGCNQMFQSWNGANCSAGINSNYLSCSGAVHAPVAEIEEDVRGSFPVATGTSTIYISSGMASMLCNTGNLNRSFNINTPSNVQTNAGSCTASSGCVTVNCSDTSTISSVSSTLTLTCP